MDPLELVFFMLKKKWVDVLSPYQGGGGMIEEVKKDIAEGLSIESPSYLTGQKRGIREAYEMMLKDMSDPVVEEATAEPRDVDEKAIEK